jgi:hypothetical protein
MTNEDKPPIAHKMKGKQNAKKYSEPTTPVQLRVPVSVKEFWKKSATEKGLSVTEWLIEITKEA